MPRPTRTVVLLATLVAANFSCSDSGPKDPELIATYLGVLGGDDGAESGTVEINLYDDDSGDGMFIVEGGGAQALEVTALNGTSFTASGGGVVVTGEAGALELTGSYAKASGDGLVAGFKRALGAQYVMYCASHSGSEGDGVYAFIWSQLNHEIRGVWSTVGVAFGGLISGQDGNGTGATMAGFSGTVTILPSVGPPAAVSGFYDLATGENGSMSGTECVNPVAPTVVSAFEGVLGGNNGTEDGTFNLTFLSDGTGSGSASVNGGVAHALGVIVSGNTFTAQGQGFTLSGTFTADDLDATYTSASGGGLAAALKKITGSAFTSFCASHSGSEGDGVYSFVWNPATHKLHGVWTTVGSAFKGIISGEDANAGGAGATMEGQTGTVTILPGVGPPATLGGFYDLGSSSITGSMGGTSCP